MISRRNFLQSTAAVAAGTLLGTRASAMEPVKRSTGPRIKLSCCAYSYRKYLAGTNAPMTLPQFIDRCAAMGLDGVELTSYYFVQPTTPEYLMSLKRQAFLLGMDVSGTSLGNNFCVAAGPARQSQCASVKKAIEHAAILGAPVIRVFAGGAPKGSTEDDARKWVIECLQECCEHAAKFGVILALENHGGVTATPDGLLSMVKQIQSPWFGVNLDTGNFHSADPYADIEKVAPYAVTTHFKSEVSGKGFAGGPVDIPRIVGILKRAGYRGYLSLEYEGREDPMTAVPRIMAEARKVVDAQA